MAEEKFKHVTKRDGNVVPFTPLRVTNAIYRAAVAVGGRNRLMAESLTPKVVEYMESTLDTDTPHVEQIQDAIEKILIETGHARTAKAFILYRDERNQKRRKRTAGDSPQQNDSIPWKKIWQALNWAIDHRVATVGQLNDRIADGSYPALVRECEEAYQLDIARAADAILRRRAEIRLVIVAGPSSSGKTTTTLKIAEHLKKEGFEFIPFHVDDYFHDLELHPKDEFGDYDYETPQAIDLELLNDHLKHLMNGEEVSPPNFNFHSGKREGTHEPIKLKENQILLIDTLHGLFGPMTEGIANSMKFKLYIETLLQMRGSDGAYIRWTDLRLIRRMVRDSVGRGKTPQSTLEHWHYVRSSELRHIVPYINTTDYIINGSLPYELPIWTARMKTDFEKWSKEYLGNPLKQDSLVRAERVENVLESITPWTDESIVPNDALLREFIGGSQYKY